MKRNVLPFGIIAVVGIFAAIIVFYIGVGQKADIQAEQDGEGNTEEVELAEPEDIFANSCASCHGDDLSGGMGPDLTAIGDKLSEDDIVDVIINGHVDMPPGTANSDEDEIYTACIS